MSRNWTRVLVAPLPTPSNTTNQGSIACHQVPLLYCLSLTVHHDGVLVPRGSAPMTTWPGPLAQPAFWLTPASCWSFINFMSLMTVSTELILPADGAGAGLGLDGAGAGELLPPADGAGAGAGLGRGEPPGAGDGAGAGLAEGGT